jgi:hypothetical protein
MGFGVKERGITRSGELAFVALKGPIKNTRVGGHGESTIYGGSAQSMGSDNLLPRSLILAKHSFLAKVF